MSRIEPDDPSFDPADWSEGDDGLHLARGIDLFNAGEYEEAHEEFEILWFYRKGRIRDFLLRWSRL